MAEDRSHGIAARVHVEDTLAWIDALPVALDGEDTLLTEVAGRIVARDANQTSTCHRSIGPPSTALRFRLRRPLVPAFTIHACCSGRPRPATLGPEVPAGSMPATPCRAEPMRSFAGHVGLDGLGRAVRPSQRLQAAGWNDEGAKPPAAAG